MVRTSDVMGRAREAIAGRDLAVVLPEGRDPRIVLAARHLVDHSLARVILIGSASDMAEHLASLQRVTVVDPKAHGVVNETLADTVTRLRPSLTPAMATRLLQKPLYLGGAMVASGAAAAMVAGVESPTKRVIEAALMTIGVRPGIKVPSSYFLMSCPHAVGGSRTVVFADCAVNADPDADDLASIAIASADSASEVLCVVPRVAFLSFSTHGSAAHARVDKVTAALARARALRPDIAFEGELQADAALVPLVAAKKVTRASDVAGQANVLVFPDLDAGNIAYKLTQYLGGATATGPFLQGFAKPVSDLSRGASVDDIVATVVLTLARSVKGGATG